MVSRVPSCRGRRGEGRPAVFIFRVRYALRLTERQEDEILSFDLEELPKTITKLRAIEKKCRDVGGEILASKQGVNEIRVTCIWQEAFISPEDAAASAETEAAETEAGTDGEEEKA